MARLLPKYQHIDFASSHLLLYDLGEYIKTHLNRLFITQKKAIRTVCNVPFNNHTSNLFVECKTLKVSDLVLMYTYIFMYHYHTNALPDTFNDLFSTNASYHSYFTRQHADLHQFLPKTTISQIPYVVMELSYGMT